MNFLNFDNIGDKINSFENVICVLLLFESFYKIAPCFLLDHKPQKRKAATAKKHHSADRDADDRARHPFFR